MLNKKDATDLAQQFKSNFKDIAKRHGFTDEELGCTDLGDAGGWTHSKRYGRLIQLAYCRGVRIGIDWVRILVDEAPWMQALRNDALRDGFTEAELDDPGYRLQKKTKSARITRYCYLAFYRGMLHVAESAEVAREEEPTSC